MTVEAAIYSILTGDATVSSLVGTRIYPVMAPQDAVLPGIVYKRISTDRLSALSADIGVAEARFQFDCYAATFDQAKIVSEAVRGALQRYKGTAGGTTIRDTVMEDEDDDFIDSTDEHRSRLDITIVYEE